MSGVTLAWFSGMAILAYRSIHQNHRAPLPGDLLWASIAFGAAALLAQANATTGTLFAVGLDIAALMNLTGGYTGTVGKAKSAKAA